MEADRLVSLILRAGQYRRATGNTRTDETPHTIKVRCYGYQFQEFPVDIDARTVTNLSQIWLEENQDILVQSGGTWEWYGGIIECNNAVWTLAGATLVVEGNAQMLGNSAPGALRFSNVDTDISSIIMNNASIVWFAIPTTDDLEGMSFLNITTQCFVGLDINNTFIDLRGFDIFDPSITKGYGFWDDRWARLINHEHGTELVAKGNLANDSRNTGLLEVRQEIEFSATSGSGAKFYTRDTNNGSRLAANQILSNPSYTADRSYELTESGGTASYTTDGGILIGVHWRDTGGLLDSNNEFDSRGLNDDYTDIFNFMKVQYGNQPGTLDVTLKGTEKVQSSIAQLVDSGITQATKSTVAAYTGIAPVYATGTLTVTITENHTINEVYDYIKYWESENPDAVWDNSKTSFISTANKLAYNYSNLVLVLNGANLTGSAGQALPTAPTVSNGAFFEDANGAIWEDSGSLYYASHAYLAVKDAGDSSDIEGAVIGFGDGATQTELHYSTSLVQGALTTDVDGEAEGYFVYKIDSTTYADTKQVTGEYSYQYSTIPRALTGIPVGTAASRETIRLNADDEVTLSKVAAGAITGITVDVPTDTIDLSDEDLPDAYDNLKYQVTENADIDTGVPGCMYYCLYGLPLNKAGTNYTGRSTSTIYQNFADGGTFSGGIIEFDTPGTITHTFGVVTLHFEADGTYDFGGSTFQGALTVDTIGDYTVTVQLPSGVSVTNNDPTNITVQQAVAKYGIAFSNLVAGSSVRVFTNGTQTILDNDESSGTTWTWEEETTGSITVDYTIQKAGYRPVRVTGVSLTAAETGGVISVQAQQFEDRAYQTSSGLTFGSTATVTVGTKEVEVSAATTVQNWYSFMIESWIAESALYNVAFPFSTNGPNSFTLSDGWEWGDGATSIAYLSRDGMRYTDGGVITASWAAFLTVGVPSGETLRYQQSDGGTTVSAAATGELDQLIQIYGDATHGNFDDTNYLVMKVQAEGYDEAVVNVVGLYGTLEDQFYVVGIAPTPNGVATGDPGISGVTITDHGASPVTWNGKNFSITITDSAGGNSGTNIMRWLRYNFEQGGSFQGTDAFNWHDLVQVNGSFFKTIRGTIYGDVGASLKGVRVVKNDGTTPHASFNLFTADDGTTYAPPVTISIVHPGLIDGTRCQLYNVTQDNELDNSLVSGGGGYSYSDVIGSGEAIEDGDTIRLRTVYVNGATAKSNREFTASASASGITFVGNQVDNTPYNSLAIDGSAQTEYTADFPNIQVDIDSPDALFAVGGLVAWMHFIQMSADGIRNYYDVVSGIDAANWFINTAQADVKLDNVNATTITQSDSVILMRDDQVYPQASPTSGGGGIGMIQSGLVFTIVSGSGVTAQDKTDIINGVWSYLVETGWSAVEANRVILAALAGKLSGADGTTITIRDILDSKDRIVATVDADGNRTSLILDGS
jgi:hypothetical protein